MLLFFRLLLFMFVSLNIGINFSNPPLTFAWTGPSGFTANTEDITNLCPGNYTIKVRNSIGCEVSKTFNICCCEADTEPGAPPSTAPVCSNKGAYSVAYDANSPNEAPNKGNIQLDVTGNTNGLTYYWTKNNVYFSSEQDLNNLDPATYCVTITNGCVTKNKCIPIIYCNVSTLAATINAIQKPCTGYPIGSVVASPTPVIVGAMQPIAQFVASPCGS